MCVVERYLNDSHVEAGLLGELLADMACWFWGGHERRFERLQLFGLDGGARAATLLAPALLLALVDVRVLVRTRGVVRLLRVVCVWLRQVGRQAAVGARRHCEHSQNKNDFLPRKSGIHLHEYNTLEDTPGS